MRPSGEGKFERASAFVGTGSNLAVLPIELGK